jgi:SAM-dependent methyltransferase
VSASDPTVGYDAAHIARFFDAYGEREWERERFERSPADRIGLEIHTRTLVEFVRPGDRVLDVGAGPGRFTIELARLGATVVVGDISAEQLRLNEQRVSEAGFASGVEERHVLDITDLSRFADASFDVVVCYGGPLSYVWEKADVAVRALSELPLRQGVAVTGSVDQYGNVQAVGGVTDKVEGFSPSAGRAVSAASRA